MDTTANPVIAAPGHVFGLRGQGNSTNPNNGIAWANRAVVPLSTHGMMVSVFPYDLNDSGLTSTQIVTIEAKAVTWRAALSFNAPTQPSVPIIAPDTALSAATLVVSALFVSTLASSLV